MKIDVSSGEVVDRLTILEIKLELIADAAARSHIASEYETLSRSFASEMRQSRELDALRAELKQINLKLWRIEDAVREHESRQDFGETFLALARSVYCHNDRRCSVKRQINVLLSSAIIEEKSYPSY